MNEGLGLKDHFDSQVRRTRSPKPDKYTFWHKSEVNSLETALCMKAFWTVARSEFLKKLMKVYFCRFSTDKRVKSQKAPNQTSETGKTGGDGNSSTSLKANTKFFAHFSGNKSKGGVSSLGLMDSLASRDKCEIPASWCETTEQCTFSKTGSSAVTVEHFLADEVQYETADNLFAQKTCDKKRSNAAGNNAVQQNDGENEAVSALGEDPGQNFYGNDYECTSSTHVYEESKPASHWSGMSKAESQRRGKNKYENSKVKQQQKTNPHVNNKVAREGKTNSYVNEDNVYDNDDNRSDDDCETQGANAKGRPSDKIGNTIQGHNKYAR